MSSPCTFLIPPLNAFHLHMLLTRLRPVSTLRRIQLFLQTTLVSRSIVDESLAAQHASENPCVFFLILPVKVKISSYLWYLLLQSCCYYSLYITAVYLVVDRYTPLIFVIRNSLDNVFYCHLLQSDICSSSIIFYSSFCLVL